MRTIDQEGICFFCADDVDVSDETVRWDGDNGQAILLHPKCAVKLGARLMEDGLEGNEDLARMLVESKVLDSLEVVCD